jgi:hypothetical protein
VVSSAWHKDSRGRFTLKVSVPVGSTAVVRVPAQAHDHVTANGTTRPSSQDRTATTANYRISAGNYTFTVG